MVQRTIALAFRGDATVTKIDAGFAGPLLAGKLALLFNPMDPKRMAL